MKGELSFKINPKPKLSVLGDFTGECFSYKGDNYIVLSQEQCKGVDPIKKSSTTIPCVNLNGPFVTSLPELTEIIPIDIEIRVGF